MFTYEEKSVLDGHDCWGRAEYRITYVVKHDDKVVFKTDDNPRELIDYLNNLMG